MKDLENIQKLLPIGYLFLVLVGISEETIFYGQLGINIIRYSTVMDILMSPLAILTENIALSVTLIFFAIVSFILFKVLPKHLHKASIRKMIGIKEGEVWTEAELSEKTMWWLVKNFVGLCLGFFFGIGVAEGSFTVGKIKNNKITYDRKLTYSSGESETIHMIGSNSCYYFFLSQGDKNVKISPVGAVKNIELTDNKRLK